MADNLQLRLRHHRGRTICPAYFQRIAQAFNRPVSTLQYLDLARTDTLQSTLISQMQLIRSQVHSHGQTELGRYANYIEEQQIWIRILCDRLQQVVPSYVLYLLGSLWDYCGAVQTNSFEVFNTAFALMTLDQEEVQAITDDGKHGICLSFNTDNIEDGLVVKTYDVLLWGTAWITTFDSVEQERRVYLDSENRR